MPVLYFPKFFHPDPTVDRQSGFLAPSLLAQKKGNYLKTPYFYVLNNSSDFTFSPRFYDNQENIYSSISKKLSYTKNPNIFELKTHVADKIIAENKYCF